MKFIHAARPSPIAGSWYSGNPDVLRPEVEAFIHNAAISVDEFTGDVFGIVVPHAGHIYSGQTAGYAYRLLQDLKRDVVVVLSPFHQYHPSDLLTTAYDAYATPLGEIAVDTELIRELSKVLSKHGLLIHQIERDTEHALEIQLPFLQCALASGFALLPLMVRTNDPKKLKLVAEKLLNILADRSFLLVASTDLSHFFPLDTANMMDAEMLRRIKRMDAEGVLAAEKEGSASACGASSVAVLLYMAKAQENARTYILNHSTSADVTNDRHSVVGYGAAAVFV